MGLFKCSVNALNKLIEWEKCLNGIDNNEEIVKFWQLQFGNSALYRSLLKRLLKPGQRNDCCRTDQKLYKFFDHSWLHKFDFVFTGWLKFHYVEFFMHITFTVMISTFLAVACKDENIEKFYFEYGLKYAFIVCIVLVQVSCSAYILHMYIGLKTP